VICLAEGRVDRSAVWAITTTVPEGCVLLKDHPDRFVLGLRHRRSPPPHPRDEHQRGWVSIVDEATPHVKSDSLLDSSGPRGRTTARNARTHPKSQRFREKNLAITPIHGKKNTRQYQGGIERWTDRQRPSGSSSANFGSDWK